MKSLRQYVAYVLSLAVFGALGYLGFRSTGGSVPYAKRFKTVVDGTVRSGDGDLVDLARGVLVAGPIRKSGLTTTYIGITAVLLAVGVGFYVYATRSEDETPTAER
ncbi:cobalamin transport operon protein [Halorutilales archaeon Cl-col2-1]